MKKKSINPQKLISDSINRYAIIPGVGQAFTNE